MIASLAPLLLVLWLLLAEPLLGRRAHRRLLHALDRGDVAARRRFYLRWTWQGWLLVAVAAAVAFGLAGWSPAALGLSAPHGQGAIPLDMAWILAGSVLLGAVIGAVAARRPAASPKTPVAGGGNVLRMLPRTAGERWGFAALAITAGLGEEFVWRGFGLAVLHHAWPGVPAAAAVVLLALPFGWAHLYQGWSGILATALIGAVMAGIYLATGSLLIPMLLHVLIDLRALLIPVPADAGTGIPSSGAAEAATSSGDR